MTKFDLTAGIDDLVGQAETADVFTLLQSTWQEGEDKIDGGGRARDPLDAIILGESGSFGIPASHVRGVEQIIIAAPESWIATTRKLADLSSTGTVEIFGSGGKDAYTSEMTTSFMFPRASSASSAATVTTRT